MNLVAKEYVAAQSEDDPGVLIFSRFAGAADELDGAIIVNPYDLEAVAEAMHLSLTMPLEERQGRWRRLLAQSRSTTSSGGGAVSSTLWRTRQRLNLRGSIA